MAYLFHNITNISKIFEITKFSGKILGLGGFTIKRVLILTLKKNLENLWRTSPPLILSKHPQRGGRIRRGTGGGDPPEGFKRGEVFTMLYP